jgi:hypothetical protein
MSTEPDNSYSRLVLFFFFSFVSFFHGLSFFATDWCPFFHVRPLGARGVRRGKKEVSWCAREEDQVLFLLDIFLLFFLSKRISRQETGRSARGNRTARDLERRGWRR